MGTSFAAGAGVFACRDVALGASRVAWATALVCMEVLELFV